MTPKTTATARVANMNDRNGHCHALESRDGEVIEVASELSPEIHCPHLTVFG
jgi:hypothetical protein